LSTYLRSLHSFFLRTPESCRDPYEERRLDGQDHQGLRDLVVRSTVNVAAGQGPTLPELAGLLAEDKPLDRTTVNS
jgi:hypothetical protein